MMVSKDLFSKIVILFDRLLIQVLGHPQVIISTEKHTAFQSGMPFLHLAKTSLYSGVVGRYSPHPWPPCIALRDGN